MSSVGAANQVLDIKLPPEPGLKRADAPIDLLAKGGEFINITVELLRNALWSAAGNRFGALFRRSDSSLKISAGLPDMLPGL